MKKIVVLFHACSDAFTPFADMSCLISYKAFYLSNLLKLEEFFLSTWALLNKQNQVHNKRNPQKLGEKDSVQM